MGNFRPGGFNRGHSGGGFRRSFGDGDSDGEDRPRRSFGGGGGFGGGRRFGGGGFGGRGGGFGGRDRPRPEMHDAICAKCKKECQVPFKPTEGKEVLCSECFEKSGGNQRSGGGRGSPNMSSEQLDKINAKLDKIMAALKIE
jgi:CxxC-x17-CxxC domain-containing protein